MNIDETDEKNNIADAKSGRLSTEKTIGKNSLGSRKGLFVFTLSCICRLNNL